jgi:hypothetical protein
MAKKPFPLGAGALDIVNRLEGSAEPLWVLSREGTNVLADALQHLRKTKSLTVEAIPRSRLGVYAISDLHDTVEWIRNSFQLDP